MSFLLYGLLGGLLVAVPVLVYNYRQARIRRQGGARDGDPATRSRTLRSRILAVFFAFICFALALLVEVRW
jgi:hypothetical protein